MYLEILSYIEDKARRITDLENIFCLNIKAPAPHEAQKKLLFEKYAKPYIEHWPDDVFFACDLSSKKTLGYLIGCQNSGEAINIFAPLLESYSLFSDLFKKFPAHLHINVHPDHHGRGVGTFLVQEYILDLKKAKVKGVHIITAPEERNVNFYTQNKFTNTAVRQHNGKDLLFMGRSL